MKTKINVFCRRFWGALPFFFFLLLDLLIALYQNLAHVMLRAIPRQILFWGIILSLYLMIGWGLWLFFRFTRKKNLRSVKFLGILIPVLIAFVMIFSLPYTFFLSVFSYTPEHRTEKQGRELLACVSGFTDTCVYYYSYENFLFRGQKELGYETYGNGSFDPFTREEPMTPKTYIFYDENGTVLENKGF